MGGVHGNEIHILVLHGVDLMEWAVGGVHGDELRILVLLGVDLVE